MKYYVALALPPRELSPNARSHYWTHAKQRQLYRQACACHYLDGIARGRLPVSFVGPVRLHLYFFLYRHRQSGKGRCFPQDPDNAVAAFKAGRDALQDAGLVTDDRAERVEVGRVVLLQTMKEHGKRCGLVVEIEEVEASSEPVPEAVLREIDRFMPEG